MTTTTTTMPLAGDRPSRKVKQFDHDEAEERAFRMLSEGTYTLGVEYWHGYDVFIRLPFFFSSVCFSRPDVGRCGRFSIR